MRIVMAGFLAALVSLTWVVAATESWDIPDVQTVVGGVDVTLVASSDGSPAPSFQWRKNGVDISGAVNATLVLNAVTLADAATYTAIASNEAGSATSNPLVLIVGAAPALSAPAILRQPFDQTVTGGSTVTFAVAASGFPDPGYQWQKNGVSIAGANNSSLTLL